MAKIRVWNIEWDTDGEVVDNLPTEVIINDPTEEMCEAVGGFDDVLVDYLSDEYGFCVFGFNADFVEKGTKMNKERAMYLVGRALGELIFNGDGYDPEEMKEWVKNEFDMTDEEFDELGL